MFPNNRSRMNSMKTNLMLLKIAKDYLPKTILQVDSHNQVTTGNTTRYSINQLGTDLKVTKKSVLHIDVCGDQFTVVTEKECA